MQRRRLIIGGLVGMLGGTTLANGARADTGQFAAAGTALLVAGPCAKHVAVTVDPALSGRVTVSATAAHPEEIAQLAVAPAEGRARVGLPPGRQRCWRPDPRQPFAPTLMLAVRVPAAFPVSVSESGEGDYAIGAVGPLEVAVSGEAAVAVDGVDGNARIDLSGEGNVSIARINAAALRVELSGSGSVRVAAGRIGALRLADSGDGAVRIDAGVGDADLSVSGVGHIALGSVSGTLRRSVTGTADITVGGRRVAGGADDED